MACLILWQGLIRSNLTAMGNYIERSLCMQISGGGGGGFKYIRVPLHAYNKGVGVGCLNTLGPPYIPTTRLCPRLYVG